MDKLVGALKTENMEFDSKCFSLICIIKHYLYSSILQNMMKANEILNNDACKR